MKKILLVLLLSLLLTGCGKEKEASKIDIYNEDITFTVVEKTVTNSKATFILENKSNYSITYGEYYSIEKEKDNSWYEVEPKEEVWFNMQQFEQDANKEKKIKINWKDSYGKLKKGKYRIIKKITINESNKFIAGEFVIK